MSTKNLFNQEAREKLKGLAEDARICMMSTLLDATPIPTRPMTLQEVDDAGSLWFISSKDSDKNYQIKNDSNVQLTFTNKIASEYLSVYGKAFIHTDQSTINEKWSDAANAWFDGKNDPNVSIIEVKPLDARYWDTKDGVIVDMAKMLYSAITGEKVDGGVEGKLEI